MSNNDFDIIFKAICSSSLMIRKCWALLSLSISNTRYFHVLNQTLIDYILKLGDHQA